jgi:hypothetical protein
MTHESIKPLAAAIAQAVQTFSTYETGAQHYDEDEPKTPRAFYVQLDSDGEWTAAFRPVADMDAEMIRWADGKTAAQFYDLAQTNPEQMATEIADDWQEDWTV